MIIKNNMTYNCFDCNIDFEKKIKVLTRDGKNRCRKCQAKFFYKTNKEKIRLEQQIYYQKNTDKIIKKVTSYRRNNKLKKSETDKQYRLKNLEKIKAYKKLHYEKNKEYYYEKNKQYQIDNKDKVNEYKLKWILDKLENDRNYKIAARIRTRIYKSMKGLRREKKLQELLGCSIAEFQLYIENYFPLYPGMSWKNYGTEWHIDHYIPISSFDLTNQNALLEACHYTNLQPLWKKDNLSKNAKLPYVRGYYH